MQAKTLHAYIYNTAATPVDRAGFGQGTSLPIVMDDIVCSSNSAENRLIDCRGRFGSHNCRHNEDVGVICVPGYTPGPGMAIVPCMYIDNNISPWSITCRCDLCHWRFEAGWR